LADPGSTLTAILATGASVGEALGLIANAYRPEVLRPCLEAALRLHHGLAFRQTLVSLRGTPLVPLALEHVLEAGLHRRSKRELRAAYGNPEDVDDSQYFEKTIAEMSLLADLVLDHRAQDGPALLATLERHRVLPLNLALAVPTLEEGGTNDPMFMLARLGVDLPGFAIGMDHRSYLWSLKIAGVAGLERLPKGLRIGCDLELVDLPDFKGFSRDFGYLGSNLSIDNCPKWDRTIPRSWNQDEGYCPYVDGDEADFDTLTRI
jgi:hypothetical protein